MVGVNVPSIAPPPPAKPTLLHYYYTTIARLTRTLPQVGNVLEVRNVRRTEYAPEQEQETC